MLIDKDNEEEKTSNIELKTTNDEQNRNRVTAPMLEGPFIRLSMTRSETRMNESKKQKNPTRKKKNQNMHGMHKHQH
jgi:hypothetical protein